MSAPASASSALASASSAPLSVDTPPGPEMVPTAPLLGVYMSLYCRNLVHPPVSDMSQ